MSKLTSEEIKQRIAELEEKEAMISEELYELRQMNQSYWIGIVDFDYDYHYHRLGYSTETEAEESIREIASGSDCLGYFIKEVSQEYNTKMYKAERLQSAYNLLNNSDFKKYAELVTELKKDLHELMEELDIPTYADICS